MTAIGICMAAICPCMVALACFIVTLHGCYWSLYGCHVPLQPWVLLATEWLPVVPSMVCLARKWLLVALEGLPLFSSQDLSAPEWLPFPDIIGPCVAAIVAFTDGIGLLHSCHWPFPNDFFIARS